VIHATCDEVGYMELQKSSSKMLVGFVKQCLGCVFSLLEVNLVNELTLKDLIKSREPTFANCYLASCDIAFITKSGSVHSTERRDGPGSVSLEVMIWLMCGLIALYVN